MYVCILYSMFWGQFESSLLCNCTCWNGKGRFSGVNCYMTMLGTCVMRIKIDFLYRWIARDVIDHHLWWNVQEWNPFTGWELCTACTRDTFLLFIIKHGGRWRMCNPSIVCFFWREAVFLFCFLIQIACQFCCRIHQVLSYSRVKCRLTHVSLC